MLEPGRIRINILARLLHLLRSMRPVMALNVVCCETVPRLESAAKRRCVAGAQDLADDPGCVKTLSGITAPGISGSTVIRGAKKRKNLSSARHYDQIGFRFTRPRPTTDISRQTRLGAPRPDAQRNPAFRRRTICAEHQTRNRLESCVVRKMLSFDEISTSFASDRSMGKAWTTETPSI
jgi:hypothetical protein